jgi:hypothetical protein
MTKKNGKSHHCPRCKFFCLGLLRPPLEVLPAHCQTLSTKQTQRSSTATSWRGGDELVVKEMVGLGRLILTLAIIR